MRTCSKFINGRCRPSLIVLLSAFVHHASAHAALELPLAEELALSADPAIAAGQARAQALQAQAIADGQLPDPKLLVGVWNVPLDDFSMKKEPSSQFRTGIRQSFPRGDSLHYRQMRTEWLSRAESSQTAVTRKHIRRDVRETFLELWYQDQAAGVISRTRDLFEELLRITRAHYAAGRVSQQDVLQAQLELSRLDERMSRVNAEREIQQATLSRWIGESAWETLGGTFPLLPASPDPDALRQGLTEHPAIRAANAEVEASQQTVKEAREQYKPGLDVGVEYRKRFGNETDGSDRPDQMAAMVTLDLPLFTEKRQDKRLAASQQKNAAAMQTRERQLRELQRQLAAEAARWQRLSEQDTLYRTRLLQEASDNAEAAVISYQSGVNEFNTLVRARVTELDIRLQSLRVRVDLAKTQARLLYLSPDDIPTTRALQEGSL